MIGTQKLSLHCRPKREPTFFFVPIAFLLVWGILLCDSWVLVRSISKPVNAQIGCQHPLEEYERSQCFAQIFITLHYR